VLALARGVDTVDAGAKGTLGFVDAGVDAEEMPRDEAGTGPLAAGGSSSFAADDAAGAGAGAGVDADAVARRGGSGAAVGEPGWRNANATAPSATTSAPAVTTFPLFDERCATPGAEETGLPVVLPSSGGRTTAGVRGSLAGGGSDPADSCVGVGPVVWGGGVARPEPLSRRTSPSTGVGLGGSVLAVNRRETAGAAANSDASVSRAPRLPKHSVAAARIASRIRAALGHRSAFSNASARSTTAAIGRGRSGNTLVIGRALAVPAWIRS